MRNFLIFKNFEFLFEFVLMGFTIPSQNKANIVCDFVGFKNYEKMSRMMLGIKNLLTKSTINVCFRFLLRYVSIQFLQQEFN